MTLITWECVYGLIEKIIVEIIIVSRDHWGISREVGVSVVSLKLCTCEQEHGISLSLLLCQ